MDTLAIGIPAASNCTPYVDKGAKRPTVDTSAVKVERPTVDKHIAAAFLTVDAPDVLPADHPRNRGFNYGAGWSYATQNSSYLKCEPIVERLRHAATLASKAAWAGEMLLQKARLAETAGERLAAVAALDAWFKANDPRDSKGDPTPNYTFGQIAAIGATPEREARATDPELIYGETI